jgi:ATP/maltotriose-dependent transcriptional regulator MalT/DNA-binding SARP family transcriptional activator
MSIRNLIILSQLNPPAQRTRVLHRDRIRGQLMRSLQYPLTILEAGTGYGKSTAILSFLKDLSIPVYWFSISGTDRDPRLFLAKLFSAFTQGKSVIGSEALRILEMPDGTPQEALIAFVNAISLESQKDSIFIIDDFHRVSDIPEILKHLNWMIENLPNHMHIIIATRHRLDFPNINKWRVKGTVFEIPKEELTFTASEIMALFEQQYGISLSEDDVIHLQTQTEGWAIGLQMVWQTLDRNPRLTLKQVLEDDRLSRNVLFEYLADEILEGLAPEIQDFLLKTSILSKLDSTTCDFLLNKENSESLLRQLQNSGFFIEELRPGVYRYHQIFKEFLNNRLQKTTLSKKELHQKIASYFRAHEYWEEALFHLFSVGDYKQINQILESIGEKMINEGRHETINYWCHEIPEEIRAELPYINYLLGEVNRYLGYFEAALENYHIAERLYRKGHNNLGVSIAVRGQAQVFLDTIRPINADQLLQDALQLLDPVEMRQEVADLKVLISENQLNLGYPDNAQRLLSDARKLRPDIDMETDLIQARIFLRTGKLDEGIALLQKREADHPPLSLSRPQRFHRESTLLLSLFFAIKGDIEKAEKYARQGIEIGNNLKSTFVQSVGFMRLGHAMLLKSQNPFDETHFDLAMAYFQEAIDKIDVTRIHVEPLWGMCRAMGYAGKFSEAEQLASESLAIAKKAGDEWISILIHLSLGASAVLSGNYDAAQNYLTTAETSAVKVKDPFTLSVSRLWLALKAWKQGYLNTAFGYLEKMLPIVKEHNYEFVLIQESLMGLRDREEILPLLIAAKNNGIEKEYIEQLLDFRDLQNINYHPGYTLWIRTLGNFKVWRGLSPIARQDWKREKALQLFQIIVGNRGKWLHRDQILSMLWPDTSVENGANYLKVIFSTLNDILEPDRLKGEAPFFIERNQDRYRINPKARVMIDADMMIEKINLGNASDLSSAVQLYQGHYFSDSLMQEWLMIEEQFYHRQFLIAADRYIEHLLEEGNYENALNITHKVLNEDNLWEPAYRAQMTIYQQTNRPGMVRKVFNQCQEVFQSQIQSQVSQKTIEHYHQLINSFEQS